MMSIEVKKTPKILDPQPTDKTFWIYAYEESIDFCLLVSLL